MDELSDRDTNSCDKKECHYWVKNHNYSRCGLFGILNRVCSASKTTPSGCRQIDQAENIS